MNGCYSLSIDLVPRTALGVSESNHRAIPLAQYVDVFSGYFIRYFRQVTRHGNRQNMSRRKFVYTGRGSSESSRSKASFEFFPILPDGLVWYRYITNSGILISSLNNRASRYLQNLSSEKRNRIVSLPRATPVVETGKSDDSVCPSVRRPFEIIAMLPSCERPRGRPRGTLASAGANKIPLGIE